MSLIIEMDNIIKQLEEMKDKVKKLEDEKIQKQNKKYTQREFVEYVLSDGRSLTARQIYEKIKGMPCENPWIDDPDDPKTPDATINSLCGRLCASGILDREQINGPYVYWKIN
jgi:hypothetical protein